MAERAVEKMHRRAKSGNGKSAIDEPEWFNIMNSILPFGDGEK